MIYEVIIIVKSLIFVDDIDDDIDVVINFLY
jgi:hypothetical protein